MEKSEIKVSCNDQVLKITESPILASGGLNEIRVAFSFCEKWNGFIKTAIFYRDAENVYYAVLDENDSCIVPWEVCYEAGTFYFSVFGEKADTRRTASVVRYKVKNGAITTDMIPSDPTPEVYDQIIAMLADMRESQAGFISVAEKAIADANIATQNAQTATENANVATDRANTAAGISTTEANKATQATLEANIAVSEARAATEETNTARENIERKAGEIIESLSGVVFADPIESTANGDVIAVSDASNQQLAGLTLYGKTTQNGTPTPSAPVPLESVGNSIGVTVAGKNLLENTATTQTVNGVTFTVNEDGSVNANGTATANTSFYIKQGYLLPAGTFVLSGCPAGGSSSTYILFIDSLNTIDSGNGKQFTVQSGGELCHIRIFITQGTTIQNLVYYPMISASGGEYEPYKGQTMTATAEGGLHGIGEVKDEIDFARGVLIRRVQEIVLDGTEKWRVGEKEFVLNTLLDDKYAVSSSTTLCTHYQGNTRNYQYNHQYDSNFLSVSVSGSFVRFVDNVNCNGDLEAFKALLKQQHANGTPVTVQYILAEPVETPLSADELSAFAELHSNKPNTTVFNDGGAGMKVDYVADTKTYIDNKFNELALAILNNT